MTTPAQIAPYGTWHSPITAELAARASGRIGELAVVGDTVYWVEVRPHDDGRSVLVRWTEGSGAADVTPPGYSVRSRVHEYGGGSYLVDGDTVYFANSGDQRLYRQRVGGVPQPLTPPGYRYADGVVDLRRNRQIWVREDHTAGSQEPVNTLVAVDPVAGGAGTVLVSGADFYAAPRLSPDGGQMSWLEWCHPNMPWTGTDLWLAGFDEGGKVTAAAQIAGGRAESIFQPQWDPAGHLFFASDRAGWWNLYRWHNGQGEPLAPRNAEFGVPMWVFHASTFAVPAEDAVVCTFCTDGVWHLATLDVRHRKVREIALPFTALEEVRAARNSAVFVGAAPDAAPAVIRVDLASGQIQQLSGTERIEVDRTYFSVGQPIEFPTTGGQSAYGIYYPPHNPDFVAPDGERPPLLVMSHGGPTAAVDNSFEIRFQHWTSRGFAILDVNYGGSSGYGRAYRERLDGQWGVVDVDDCVNGARYLVEQGLVDPQRLAIRGGSAGGYTTLMALATRSYFKAGASFFGLSDLEFFARDTHKFESHYLDSLIGPYPEQIELYHDRSALYHLAGFTCPVIFFQGLEDKVVPPNQAEIMVDALREKGIPVAYVTYPGEDHGFRQAKHIRHALEAELYFYGRIFGFPVDAPSWPVVIDNLDAA
jgi:dipeptidyl aminopeptidase/acylaminoacyl peptidase